MFLKRIANYKRVFLLINIIFTILMLVFVNQNFNKQKSLIDSLLVSKAKAIFENILDTREWNARFNGVYVNADIEPNRYLRDNILKIDENRTLVKINPAWMTRQISEISNKKNSFYFKITSTNPLNPNNMADLFEKSAIEYFEKNRDRDFFYKFEKDNFDFMGKLLVKESCLNCHREQGYKLGDIRGGIRISISTDLYNKEIYSIEREKTILSVIIVLISLLIYVIFYLFIKTTDRFLRNTEKLNISLEQKVRLRTQELEDLNKSLTQEVITDALTGVYNRKMFNNVIYTKVEEVRKFGFKLSLIIFDIDFFKKVNDTYGHQVGDLVLKEIAKVVNENIRQDDLFFRWGGEEFTILLNRDLTIAIRVAKHLREAIKKHKFEKVGSITCSFGVSEFNSKKTLSNFIKEADDLLYLAKKKGRDRVEF